MLPIELAVYVICNENIEFKRYVKSFSQSIFSKFWLSDELGREQNWVNFERRGHAEYKQLTLCKLVAPLQIISS